MSRFRFSEARVVLRLPISLADPWLHDILATDAVVVDRLGVGCGPASWPPQLERQTRGRW